MLVDTMPYTIEILDEVAEGYVKWAPSVRYGAAAGIQLVMDCTDVRETVT